MLSMLSFQNRNLQQLQPAEIISPDQLKAVVGHIAVPFDKLMLVWGGYCMSPNNYEIFYPPDKLLVYDTVCDKWFSFTTFGDVPKNETTGACAIVVDTTLYIFGGFCDHSYDYARLYALDLRTLVWRCLQPRSAIVPTVRHKLVGWHYKDKLYYFGGFGPPPDAHFAASINMQYLHSRTSRFVNDDSLHDTSAWNNQLIAFNLVTENWEIVPLAGDAPSPRAAHSAVAFAAPTPESNHHKVLVFGGRLLDQRLNDVYVLDTPSMVWTKVDTNPGPCGRSWHTTVPVDSDHVLLFGGFSQDCVPLNDTWLYNVSRRVWTRVDDTMTKETTKSSSSSRTPRLWHTAVSINGTCYLFGGCTTNIFALTSGRQFSNELGLIGVTPRPLLDLCLQRLRKHGTSPTTKSRLLSSSQLPGSLCHRLQFMYDLESQNTTAVTTPWDLLRI